MGEFEGRSVKPRESVEGFTAREFSQTLPRFSTGYGGTDNMFYFFYKKIIFSYNKEKDDIRGAYCKFSQFADSQPHCSRHFRAMKHTCRPIKTHVISKLFYKYIYKLTRINITSPQVQTFSLYFPCFTSLSTNHKKTNNTRVE